MGGIDFLNLGKDDSTPQEEGYSLEYTNPQKLKEKRVKKTLPRKKAKVKPKNEVVKKESRWAKWKKNRKIKKERKQKNKQVEINNRISESEPEKKIELLSPEVQAKQRLLEMQEMFKVPAALQKPGLEEVVTARPALKVPVNSLPKSKVAKNTKIKKSDLGLGLEVNLMPQANRSGGTQFSGRVFTLTALGTLGLVAVIYSGMLGGQYYFLQRTQELQTEIENLDREIQTYDQTQEKMSLVDTKVKATSWALDHHIYWTEFFTNLEAYTLPEVTYQNFSGDTQGLFTLQAEAPNYEIITQQVATLAGATDFVKEVKVDAASLSQSEEGDRVSFKLNLELQPDIFYKL